MQEQISQSPTETTTPITETQSQPSTTESSESSSLSSETGDTAQVSPSPSGEELYQANESSPEIYNEDTLQTPVSTEYVEPIDPLQGLYEEANQTPEQTESTEQTENSQEVSEQTESIESTGETIEPADLYVYRYAETKAIQIGKVTRLLKEIAVDCILNIEQTNFTVDKLLTLAQNQNIKLNLSTNNVQIDFKVGDKPFSDICDYMDNCNFTCSPSAQINDEDINKTTYSEEYVKMNYSTIVKRIRDLFKEHTMYNRENLISGVNHIKVYPVEQIDYVLTRFIDNDNEYITDKYGRTGRLINKDKYYAFQPIEITDEHISLFERTAPVDFKPQNLELELLKKLREPAYNLEEPVQNETEGDLLHNESTQGLDSKYNEILEQIKVNMSNALLTEDTQIASGEIDWYKNMGNVFQTIIKNHNIREDYLTKYAVYHNLDTLAFEERMVLVKNLYVKSPETQMTQLEQIMKEYFDKKVVHGTDGSIAIVMVKEYLGDTETKWKILAQERENPISWNEIDDTDYAKYRKDIGKFIIKKSTNNVIGFMHLFRNGETIFKTKVLPGRWGNKGVYCNILGKKDVLDRLNSLLDTPQPMYTNESIRKYFTQVLDKKGVRVEKRIENGIYRNGLCVILEILLRYYHDIEHKGKEWFFDVEKTIINNIVNLKELIVR